MSGATRLIISLSGDRPVLVVSAALKRRESVAMGIVLPSERLAPLVVLKRLMEMERVGQRGRQLQGADGGSRPLGHLRRCVERRRAVVFRRSGEVLRHDPNAPSGGWGPLR